MAKEAALKHEAPPQSSQPQKHPLEDVLRKIVKEELHALVIPVRHTDEITPVSTKVLAPSDVKPILLHDSDRQAIERMTGGIIINTPQDVVAAFMKLTTFNIKGIGVIELPHDVLARIESRVPIDTKARDYVTEQFSRFVEMLVDGAF